MSKARNLSKLLDGNGDVLVGHLDNAVVKSAGTGVSISGGGEIAVTSIALSTVQTAGNQSAHLALTAQAGDVVVRTDESKTYIHNGGSAGNMNDFTLMIAPAGGLVQSVAGHAGVVTATQLKAAIIPSQGSNSGKFLTTNGSAASWATVDALPSQTNNSGKFLTSNGSAASWAVLNTDSNTTTKGLYEHAHTIAANYSITSGNNAIAAGPMTINSGISVTVPSGSTLVIA